MVMGLLRAVADVVIVGSGTLAADRQHVCKTIGRLLANFFQQRLVSEQFLTMAPQIAGRVAGDGRLGMVMGKVFAPRHPLWGQLMDVRQGASHLFLRYSFA
jgi:riboflavin biosynthesis pyrimidine reductase